MRLAGAAVEDAAMGLLSSDEDDAGEDGVALELSVITVVSGTYEEAGLDKVLIEAGELDATVALDVVKVVNGTTEAVSVTSGTAM